MREARCSNTYLQQLPNTRGAPDASCSSVITGGLYANCTTLLRCPYTATVMLFRALAPGGTRNVMLVWV